MKAIGNLLLAILGIILISFSLKLLIIDKSEYGIGIVFVALVFGSLLIYPSVKKNITFKNKRFIKDLLLVLLGVIFIAFSLKLLIIDKSDEYAQIIGGLVFGLLMIYPSFKKDSASNVEKFVEKENIEVVIWWKRLISFLIDFIVLCFIYSITMTIILKFFQIRIDKLYGGPLTISPFFVFYYTVQEYLFQTTIGKLPFRLKVVSTKSNAFIDKEAGSNPTFFQILIRSLTRLLFVIDIFFFFFKRPIGLHDITSKTIVIKK